MPSKFTRGEFKVTFNSDGVVTEGDSPFALGPNDRAGSIPPENDGEESLTLRVIKTQDGAEILIRFSQGIDAYTVHAVGGLSAKDLADEVADIARTMVKGLLDAPAAESYRKEVEPGIWEAVTTGRPAHYTVESFTKEFYTACDRIESKGMKITINNVAHEMGRWDGSTLKYHLKNLVLSFKKLVKSRPVS